MLEIAITQQELRVIALLMLVWVVGAANGNTTTAMLGLLFIQMALGIVTDGTLVALLIVVTATALLRDFLRIGRRGG